MPNSQLPPSYRRPKLKEVDAHLAELPTRAKRIDFLCYLLLTDKEVYSPRANEIEPGDSAVIEIDQEGQRRVLSEVFVDPEDIERMRMDEIGFRAAIEKRLAYWKSAQSDTIPQLPFTADRSPQEAEVHNSPSAPQWAGRPENSSLPLIPWNGSNVALSYLLARLHELKLIGKEGQTSHSLFEICAGHFSNSKGEPIMNLDSSYRQRSKRKQPDQPTREEKRLDHVITGIPPDSEG